MTYINVSKKIPLKRKAFGLIKSVTSMCDSENLQGESDRKLQPPHSHDAIADCDFFPSAVTNRIV